MIEYFVDLTFTRRNVLPLRVLDRPLVVHAGDVQYGVAIGEFVLIGTRGLAAVGCLRALHCAVIGCTWGSHAAGLHLSKSVSRL